MTHSRCRVLLIAAGAFVAVLAFRWSSQLAVAQQPAAGGTAPPGAAESGSSAFVPDAGQELQLSQERTAGALKRIGDAESDEQRAAAEAELQQAVAEQFELLMKPREAQIEELKARLDKLTEQLKKRREAKDEIVKLRVQVLISEADGLGFYPEGTAGWPAAGEYGYPGMSGGYGADYGAGYGSVYSAGRGKVPKGVPTQPRAPNVPR